MRKFFSNRMKGAATAAIIATSFAMGSASATELKLSHQWSTKDVRHKVAQMVADDVAAAGVDLEIKIFPGKALFKPKEQYTAMSRGRLDMTVLPLAYAAGQRPAYNLTLMPGMVKNHDHGARLTSSPFMKEIENIMAKDDGMILVHGYLAGGFGGKDKCITGPDDVKGMQMRAAGKAFEEMVAAAGASIASMPSSEIYSAMQTGVLNGANTSSSSFVSYRLYEQIKCFTPAGDVALWFMYQPMLISKSKFESLNADQQAALLAASKKAQAFYLTEAKKADNAAADKFREAGVEIAAMSDADFNAWREIAKGSSYKTFVEKTENGQKLLDLALAVE